MAESGQKQIDALRFGGASEEDISIWKDKRSTALLQGGASQSDVNSYWGDKEFDQAPMKAYVKENFAKAQAETAGSDAPKEANDFADDFMAGLQGSYSGLKLRGDLPNVELAKNPSLGAQILFGAGQFIGDIPAMAAGGFFGAGIGAAAGEVAMPVGGGVIGAGYGFAVGSFAAPPAMRKMLIDHYTRGDIKTPEEFIGRLAGTTWEAIKGGVTGLATAGAGNAVKALGAGTYTALATELGTMTGVSAAFQGHLPSKEELAANALLVGTLHGIVQVSENLGAKYVETGAQPSELVEKAQTDAVLHQELLTGPAPKPEGDVETFEVGGDGTIAVPKPPEEDTIVINHNEALHDEDQLKILSHVEQSKKETFVDKVKAVASKLFDLPREVRKLQDDLSPLKEMQNEIAQGEKIDPKDDLHLNAALYRRWPAKLKVITEHGTFDYHTTTVNGKPTNQINGESYLAVLDKIPKVRVMNEKGELGPEFSDKNGAIAYSSARRAIEKSKQTNARGEPIETGFDLEAAKRVVKNGKRFEAFHDAFQAFGDRMMKYAVDGGILTPAEAKLIKEMNQDYFPMHTVMEHDPFNDRSRSGSVYKPMKGSKAKKTDPLSTYYKNIAAIIRAVEKNKIATMMDTVAKKNIEISSQYIVKLKRDVVPIKVQVEELQKHLEGVEGADQLDFSQLEALTIFRAKDVVLGKDNILRFKKNGKYEYRQVTPEIADSMRALDVAPYFQHIMWKVLTEPTRWLNAGVTKDPAFAQGSNIARDAGQGLVTEGIIPFSKTKETITKILTGDPEYVQALIHGAISTSLRGRPEFLESDVWKLQKETGVLEKVWNVIKSPLQAYEALATAGENSTRLAAYSKAGGGIPGAKAGRGVSVNFDLGSTFTRAWTQIDAFFGPSIQGLARTLQAFGPEQRARTVKYMSIGLLAPTMLNWYRNKDNSKVQNAKRWEGATYWYFPVTKWDKALNADVAAMYPEDLRKQVDGVWYVDNGPLMRFPKPQVFGQIASALEHTLNASYEAYKKSVKYKDNPEEYAKHASGGDLFRDLEEDISQAISLNILPDAVRAPIEQWANKVFFTGQPIIQHNLEDVAPQFQYRQYTSESAKQLGKIIGTVPFLKDFGPDHGKLSSPLEVENYIRSWTGGLGKLVTQITDAALTAAQKKQLEHVKPPTQLADIPYVRAFVARNPTWGAAPLKDFFEREGALATETATFNKLNADALELADPAARAELVKMAADRYQPYVAAANMAAASKAVIGQLNKALQAVNIIDKDANGHTYTRDDKGQLIDGFYYKMIDIARQSNVMLKQMEEQREK